MTDKACSNNKKIKILHLINDLGCGGAQKVIYNLLCEIDRKRFLPVIGIWGRKWGHEMVEQFSDSNIEVVDFEAHSRFDPKSINSLYKYLSKNHVDILHTHLFLMHIIGRVVGRSAGIPRIVSTHHNLLQSNNAILRVLEKLSLPLCDVTTSVSRAAQKSYYSVYKDFTIDALHSGNRHFTIYNPVNTDDIQKTLKKENREEIIEELGLQDKFVFSCVGRLHPSKGHTYLFAAVEQLRNIHPNIKILIIGDGPLAEELKEEARSKRLDKVINFLGYRNDVFHILSASNALVQPSVFEGFGLASAEALACGIPVISTTLPSIAEVVQDKKSGLLVPPGDVYALAKAMAYLIENPDIAAVYGQTGRQFVEDRFSSTTITRQYEDLYQTLAEM